MHDLPGDYTPQPSKQVRAAKWFTPLDLYMTERGADEVNRNMRVRREGPLVGVGESEGDGSVMINGCLVGREISTMDNWGGESAVGQA